MRRFVICCLAVITAIVSPSASLHAGNEVTVKGMVLNNVHTGENRTCVFVYALEGTPEIRAEMDRIMAQNYPDKGLDADAARKLQDQFTAKLKYFIDGPYAEELCKKATYGARQPTALTGVIAEKDGKRWITVSKYADATLQYPAKMLAGDKPLVMPNKAPLLLKINEKLLLKCIWVPPGKFLMGEPYYQCPHWQEAPPHMVTLTKGFYMAEHPISQEMFEAVVGNNPSMEKAAKAPVNASCAGMYEFCRNLSQKNGRNVRVPTAAEWEYAARVGTSNPAFREKYKDQDSSNVRPMAVKSRLPNAWGFYDMVSSGWERMSDGSGQLDRQDTVDPQHIPPEDQGKADQNRKHGHFGKGNAQYAVSELEYISSEPGPENTYPGVTRFRVVVDGP
ncbi:MAG: formylglycine-generating enzyme family protein [Thermoguttaceae bacterium]